MRLCKQQWQLSKLTTSDLQEGKAHNFENAVAHIIPEDPVAEKRIINAATGKRAAAEISATDCDSPIPRKRAKGTKTGVELRFHKNPECHLLSDRSRKPN